MQNSKINQNYQKMQEFNNNLTEENFNKIHG
jgi:hypothetical protein